MIKTYKKNRVIKKIIASILATLIIINIPQTALTCYAEVNPDYVTELETLTNETLVQAVVYLADEIDIKESADSEALAVTTVTSGQTVDIKSAVIGKDGGLWFLVRVVNAETEYVGYIQDAYLAYSNEKLIEWKREFIPENVDMVADELIGDEPYADVFAFPESYQAALYQLKMNHPNWIFVKMDTSLEWDTVIRNELGTKNLVPANSDLSWKNGSFSQNWSVASENIVKYYMDPRNFLSESYLFQFEQLTYNSSYHTVDAVQKILADTFMAGTIPDDYRTYSVAFCQIGSELQVSPFHLACRVYQEQGKGTSPLISGTYPGYEGYYNYFNVGATGASNAAVISSGLKYAKNHDWNSRFAALYGGADTISKYYIRKGQDTLYLQKFDVENEYNGLYTHQYMQNLLAPASEGINVKNAYRDTDSLENPFVFKIPVYQNMPAEKCPKPPFTSDNNGTDPTTAPQKTDPEPEKKPEPAPVAKWPFTDVKEQPGDWKYDGIKYVYDKNIMTGFAGGTTFGADSGLTRGQFATILYRIDGSKPASKKAGFPDVADGKYYTAAVDWCAEAGVVTGYANGQFKPEAKIERQQLAVMIYRFNSYIKRDCSQRADMSSFPDNGAVADYAKDAMSWCVKMGVLTGKNKSGTFYLDPTGRATRAECAAMIARYHKMVTGQ